MFEGLIEKLILSYFGDYIENLDRNKLSVGILSGSLTLEDVVVRAKTINDMKLPFRLIYGRLGKIDIKIPWKSNFTAPTVINIECVQVVLSLIPQEEWDFLDFFSADHKLNYLKKFFENRIAELTEAFVQEEKSSGYVDRVLIKILDNLHINFKNLNIRIEDMTKKPFYSLGFTLEEMLVVNTNEKWEEKFIDRNKQKDINVFKLLKIQNFGFYLKTDETYVISPFVGDNKKIREEMNNLFPMKCAIGKNLEYLIKPISLVAKMKQNNTPEEGNENLIVENSNNLPPKILIWIDLENFDINFIKHQFDTIIRILNHTTRYQRFQHFNFESRRYFFYKPQSAIKEDKKAYWRYAITSVMKRMKYLQGNTNEFAINPLLTENHKKKFHEIYAIYLKDPSLIPNDDWRIFKRILTLYDLNILYEWAIENIQEYFTLNKKEENKKAKKGFFGKFFGSGKKNEETLLTKEEEEKILEIIEYAKKEVKKEIIYSGKEIKLQIEFHLHEGSFNFSNYKKDTLEGFSFQYKNLSFMLKNAESFTEIEAYLKEFNVDMLTQFSHSNGMKTQITFKENNTNSLSNSLSTTENNEDYVWKLKMRQNGPGEKINSKLDLHVKNINLIYHQAFLERVLSFFIVETSIDEDLVNRAWDKWSEIKEKTSESIKLALEKKNILEIHIEPRKVVIPLNKYDYKRSKVLVLEIGKVTMCNTEGTELYEDQYLLDFGTLSIVHFGSMAQMQENKSRYELVSDLRLKLLMSIMSAEFRKDEVNDIKYKHPLFKMNLTFDSVKINLTESIYYMFHFIIDVMKPTKQQDYWAVVEQSKQEIKKNCKALGKVGKKNYLKQRYEEVFGVLSGGYIYFYKNVDDDEFISCYYIKDAVISEKIRTEGEVMLFDITLKNKYGTLDLEFTIETKFKQWSKGIRERVNEIRVSLEGDASANQTSTENIQTSNTQNNLLQGDMSLLEIPFGLEINIKEVTCYLNDENDEFEKLFTLQLSEFNFLLTMREKDITIQMSLYSVQIFDELYKDHQHKDSFYQILSSVDSEQSNYKLFSIDILIADKGSPKYNKAGIELDVKIGYLYAIWLPGSIRRLLMFLAHNEILRSKIKEQIIGVPTQLGSENTTENPIGTHTTNNMEERVTCAANPNDLWIYIDISLQKVSIIWVQPALLHYFMEVRMRESSLSIAMTLDHFNIKGVLGNTSLTDLTNYPYTIKSQDEYLEITSKNNYTPTEILGFKDSSSLSFEYNSYSHFCPLVKNNYTSSAKVYFNSVRLTYIQEHFFRMFNYLFQEFLGALAPSKEIKEYKNMVNKMPQQGTVDEFLDLHCEFNNPQVLLKARPGFDESFLADLGNVVITNSYTKMKNKLRLEPQVEKTVFVYHFALNNLYLIARSSNENFKLIEDTDAKVDMYFTNLTEEEKVLPDEVIDKSFDINLFIGDVKMNLRQKDFTHFMKCNDLNFVYVDGLNLSYEYEKFQNSSQSKRSSLTTNNNNSGSTPISSSNDIKININTNINQNNTNSSTSTDNINLKDYNYMAVNLKIPSISLKLFENTTNNVFTELILKEKSLHFVKKLQGSKEITVLIKSSEVYNYVSVFSKEIMLSYYSGGANLTNNNNSGNTNNNLSTGSTGLTTYTSNQFDIKVVFDKDGEKNIIIKICNVKFTLRLDILQLLRTFFTQGLPYYEEDEADLPNQYDFDEDNYPGMRVYLEIKNPLISLLSETMTNHDQDVICLSTDLVFLYKKEKIIKARRELYNNYLSYAKLIHSNDTKEEDKKLLEADICSESKDIYLLSVWLYDICPYVCNLSEILSLDRSMESSNFTISKRKLMNNFNFHYQNKTILQYNHPNNYIQSYKSNIDIKLITVKISYRDLVLFLKTIEYNVALMDKEYEDKMRDLTNPKRVEKMLKDSEKFMNPVDKEEKFSIYRKRNSKFVNESEAKWPNMRKSKTSDDVIIDKGMGVMSIESGGLQIILIDDHANTYYPFLSIIIQDLKVTNEYVSFTQNGINGSFLIKVVTYNYYAGIWEPFLEKTLALFEIINEKSDSTLNYRTINFNLQEYRPRQTMNINISDINITFLYSTLSSWIDKYLKLKSDYREEVKKMIAHHSEKNMTITNHTVINLTGRNLILHRAFISKEKNITFKKLSNVSPNETYDIEYLEDEKELENNNIPANADISLNLVRENYICFEFSGIDQSKIAQNIIKIDNTQLKTHKINYIDIIKKYKTNIDLKSMEYIVSEVRYHDLRKFVYFYSPLVFKNKLNKKISLVLRRKELNEMKIVLEPKKQIGVPFEYLDGSVEFTFNSESNSSGSQSVKENTFDVKSFILTNFARCELKIQNSLVNILTHNQDNKKKKFVTINICASYIVRNCLPFDIELLVLPGGAMNQNNKLSIQPQNYIINKAERVYIESHSFQDNLQVYINFLNFSSNKKTPITLFNTKEYKQFQIKKERDSSNLDDSNTGVAFSSSFVVYDMRGNPLTLFAALVEALDSKTIVIYSNGVIINNTMMDLRYYYYGSKGKEAVEVAGQEEIKKRSNSSSSNSNNNLGSNKNNLTEEFKGNVLLISDEKQLVIEVINLGVKEIISEALPLNAIGLSTNVECRKREKEKKICYEFIMETHLSLVAQDLEIYTNIISIHPKFVVCNNLNMPMLICIYQDGTNYSPDLLHPQQKKPFDFYGMGSETPVCFRPVENINNNFQSGSKWNWSLPISLVNTGLLTIQISGINPIEKAYINIEKKLVGYTTFVILSEANYFNSQFVVENYSRNVSVKIYQEGFENSPEYANIKSKCLYAWSDYNGARILYLEYMLGSLNDRPIAPNMNKNFLRRFAIGEDRVILSNGEEKVYPVSEVMKLQKDQYSGFLVKTEILTDGMQKTIKITDYILDDKKESDNTSVNENTQNSNNSKTISSTKINSFNVMKNFNFTAKTITEINIRIKKLGVSLISDNRNIKRNRMSYNRYEIVYLTFNDIFFFNRVLEGETQGRVSEMQTKVRSVEIDNQYAYITQYPIVLRPTNIEKDPKTLDLIVNPNDPPFINFTVTSYRNNNNPNETTKILLLNYLVQSFVLSIDSEVVESVLNFVSNVTIQLNTSLTQINGLFESQAENFKKGVKMIRNYLPPDWVVKEMSTLSENRGKYFIQTMETSSIEMILSFLTQTKSKVFEKYVTSNPILSKLLSTMSNIEKANIMLNGSKMHNLYGSLLDFFQIIMSMYKQNTLRQVFHIFGAIDVLGNPSNLVNNLGTGVTDFFQKPMQGIIKGPLEGVKGAIDGSVSLFKHTVDGTFNATSKITGGLSKGILYFTQDEKYMNELEKKKITQRPKNFVEGLGFGITTMAGGLLSGVRDVIEKPVEGAKKESVFGFVKGVGKGVGGFFAKPISGVLELVSKTTEGIKNTITQTDENTFKPDRKPRCFYGKFKYIKSYNYFHADVVDIVKNKIEQFKNVHFDFYSAEIYKNHKGDTVLMLFTTENMYLIDLSRREIKALLNYKDIQSVILESSDKIRVTFKNDINNKSSAAIFFNKESSTAAEICDKIKEAIDDNSETLNF